MNTASAEVDVVGGGRDGVFFAAVTLVFGFATTLTIYGSVSMPWMRMPGQTRPGMVAGFLGMWVVMMVAMMLPSLVPALWRYRRALRMAGETRLGRLTTALSAGYFVVWSAIGIAALPVSLALAAIPTWWPAVGALLLFAGLLQFTAWKARHLACCRAGPGHGGSAWRQGVRRGLHCCCCCAGPTAILLAFGLMDLRAMALVMLAVTTERLAPAGERIARAIGAIAITSGLLLI